jgi:RNA polymerase sigma factor (sigma-70 family)
VIDAALLTAATALSRRVVRHGTLPPAIDVDDLAQAGLVGALEAARRWRPDGGAALRTFAYSRMVGAMRDAVRAAHHVDRRDVGRRGLVPLLPIASAANVPAAGPSLERLLLTRELLAGLPPRLRCVLEQYYLKGRTLASIARTLRVNESRVCQLKTQALARLRKQVT